MSDYTPMSELDLKRLMVWEPGIYDFEVMKSEVRESQAGNNMIVLDMKVFQEDGTSQLVTDYLVAKDHALCLMKLRHYCRCTDSMDAYESGDLAQYRGAGASGKLKLGIQDSEEFGPKNVVKDYLFEESTNGAEGVPAAQAKKAREAAPSDDVPFSLLVATFLTIVGSTLV